MSETELLLLAVGVVMTTIYCDAFSRLGNKVAARNTVPVPFTHTITTGYEPTLRFYCAQEFRSTFVQAFADLDIGSAVHFGALLRVSSQHSAEFAQFPSGSTTRSSCPLFQPRQYKKRSRYPAAAQISRNFRPVPSGFPPLLPFPGPYLHLKAST